MAEHNHSKELTLTEKFESYTLRASINETNYRLQLANEQFLRNLNSGYCAFELIKAIHEVEDQLKILRPLLKDLGEVEHYNFEAALAQLPWEDYLR